MYDGKQQMDITSEVCKEKVTQEAGEYMGWREHEVHLEKFSLFFLICEEYILKEIVKNL